MTMKFRHFLILLLVPGLDPSAHAISDDSWDDISNVGVVSLIGTALILSYTREDWNGLQQSTYSMLTATGVSLLGKTLVDKERPDNSGNDSFASGHTACLGHHPVSPLWLADGHSRLRGGGVAISMRW